MAYSKQTWDTTSIFNPTRMNHIEDGIEGADTKTADDIPYSSGVSVKDKIDEVDGKTADDIPYDSNNSVKDKIDEIAKVVTSSFTAQSNVTIGSQNFVTASGRFAYISLVIGIQANISANTYLVKVDSNALRFVGGLLIMGRRDSNLLMETFVTEEDGIKTNVNVSNGDVYRFSAMVPITSL